MPGICAGDNRSRYGVKAPLDKAALSQGVIAAVLTQDAGQNAFYPEVLIRLVCEGVPIISAISGGALAKCRIGIRCLTDTCLDADENERGIVEAIQGAGLE